MSDCIFCKIVKGTIPSKKVYEDDELLAFRDSMPVAPVHILLIPKKHIQSLLHTETEDSAMLGRLMNKAGELAKEPGLLSPNGCGESGARFVINAGRDAKQSVDHLHIHILGGRSFGWPPG